jgi:Domain of unknown function (DUF4190)
MEEIITYQVARDGEEIGLLTEEELVVALEEGELLLSDSVWTEGMEEWITVSELVDVEEIEPEAAEPVEVEVGPAATAVRTVMDNPPIVDPRLKFLAGRQAGVSPPAGAVVPHTSRAKAVVHVPVVPSSDEPSLQAPVFQRITLAPMKRGQYGVPGIATASLVVGILSFLAPILLSLVAVVCGHLALKKIRLSDDAYDGSGVAVSGLILGYITGALGVVLLCLFMVTGSVLPQPIKAMLGADKEELFRASTEIQLQQLSSALKTYAQDHGGKYPDALEELVATGAIDQFFMEKFHAIAPENGSGLGWEYNGRGMAKTDGYAQPVVLSRFYNSMGQRMVLTNDGKVEMRSPTAP